jgi:stage II sporulation protein D
MSGPLAALLALLLTGPPSGTLVEVELLSSRPTASLVVEGPGGRRDLSVRDGQVLLGGRPVGASLRLEAARWRVRLPAGEARELDGALELRAAPGRLRLVARLPLEQYVAWTVASETEPSTPPEALRAQAVVARSYALGAGRRHADVDLCDLAHCQLLRGRLGARQLAAAHRAAEATRGQLLRLADGQVALAPFHAACGGQTGDPFELFGGEGTGAASVPDPGCPVHAWRAVVPLSVFEAVVAERLGAAAPPERLEWRRGQGGYLVQVAFGAAVTGGEGLARALDGRLGHRSIRSSRFTVTPVAQGLLLEGSGLGHGVGLCQAGAARRAASGAGWREILRHYFPYALVGPVG